MTTSTGADGRRIDTPSLHPALRRNLSFALALAIILAGCGSARTSPSASEQSASSLQPSATPSASIDPGTLAALTAPIPGRIAYNNGDGALWIMNGDGSDRRRLTNPPGNDFDPKWTPGGQQITFRTDRGVYAPDVGSTGIEGIFLFDLRTGRERQIFPPNAKTLGGLFADPGPDGRFAVSTVDRPHGGWTEVIAIIDATGKRLRTIEVGGSGECSRWSPDGGTIAYCHHPGDGNFAVWLMNADGSRQRRLSPSSVTQAGPGPWSRDGKQLLFSARTSDEVPHVFVADADGTHVRQLTTIRGAPDIWLPDGRIIFESWPSDTATQPNWYVMTADGSAMVRLKVFEDAHMLGEIAWHG